MSVVIEYEREMSLTEASKNIFVLFTIKYYIYLSTEMQIINIIMQGVLKLHKQTLLS